jgi:tRNA (guanine10-N2)-methyltransferase
MPTANDEVELDIPLHSCLEIVSVCVQPFNKCESSALAPVCRRILQHSLMNQRLPGSRRLLTYRRMGDAQIQDIEVSRPRDHPSGIHANDLNNFRKRV